jgi:plastocyanin
MSFTFPTPGDYGFYCNTHQAFGMYGVVRVH